MVFIDHGQPKKSIELKQEICGSCRLFRFKGFLWWCKEHDRQIKKWNIKCDDWIDMFEKKGLKE